MFESALQAGFLSAGIDVVLAGCIPTPAIAYLTRSMRLTAGIVISASHNPYHDNGIKFFDTDGNKLPYQIEKTIESTFNDHTFTNKATTLGNVSYLNDAVGRYIEFCKATFPSNLSLTGMNIIVDAANGASSKVIEAVLTELGAKVTSIASSPNGVNINQNVGTTFPQNIAKAVIKFSGDYGIALDGDGDRFLIIDEKGKVFEGDQLLYSIAKDMVRSKGLNNVQGVVGTLMSNFGLEKSFQEMGLEFRRSRVGDRFIAEMLRQTGWNLGGETSGHILNLNFHTTGDGIINSLQVLATLINSDVSLSKWTEELNLLPQFLLNIPISRFPNWHQDQKFLKTQNEIGLKLKDKGRLLVRPSGTEPLLRIMVESNDENLSKNLALELQASLKE
jgi:phosphoglucosamine mutase